MSPLGARSEDQSAQGGSWTLHGFTLAARSGRLEGSVQCAVIQSRLRIDRCCGHRPVDGFAAECLLRLRDQPLASADQGLGAPGFNGRSSGRSIGGTDRLQFPSRCLLRRTAHVLTANLTPAGGKA